MTSSWTERVFERLSTTGKTLALAESCTGGGASAELTSLPGASKIFRGSIVAYANAAKIQLLKVPKEMIDKKGAVSAEVAIAMASGARKRFGSDVAAAVTGLAGPGYSDPCLPIGTVWIAFVDHERQEAVSEHFEGGRASVRAGATQSLFRYLALFLDDEFPK